MSELLTQISTGIAAFTATNIDDLVVLLLFFSSVNLMLRRRHIVVGQYLGFTTLVIASLPSYFGSMFLPQSWIGLLGIVPILIGMSRLVDRDADDVEVEMEKEAETQSLFSSFLSPQTYSVAAVTVVNGGDNIGIYVPLFASSTWESLLVILSVFFSLVGVWCYAAYRLTKIPAIAYTITRYGNQFVPFVLISLGVLIFAESHALENGAIVAIALTIGCVYLLNLSQKMWRAIAVATERSKP